MPLEAETVDPRVGSLFGSRERVVIDFAALTSPFPRALFDLTWRRKLLLRDGSLAHVNDLDIPASIRDGSVSEKDIKNWAGFRSKFGDLYYSKYRNIFQAAEDALGIVYNSRPIHRQHLASRLIWTESNPEGRVKQANEERVKSTDLVRGVLIPRYHKKGLSLLTQARLIHRAHTKNKEHIIFEPNQASVLLQTNMDNLDRIAGIIRSKDELAFDIGMSNGKFLCADHKSVVTLTEKLFSKAESLFPLGSKNDAIDQHSIYFALSSIQYLFALIHPMYEANGRVSEDLMYAFWQRRPDLKRTVRYPSSNGMRTDQRVDERALIIDRGAEGVIQKIAIYVLGVKTEEVKNIKTYEDLTKFAMSHDMGPNKLRRLYFAALHNVLDDLINRVGSSAQKTDRTIRDLAKNLRDSSSIYTYRS